MDIGSVVANQASQAQNTSAANVKSSDIPNAAKKSEIDNTKVEVPAIPQVDLKSADQRRFQTVRSALHNSYKNFYAVSDQSFTIYKDQSGQLITRFTNLRDGKVTYIPEQDALAHLSTAALSENILSVNV